MPPVNQFTFSVHDAFHGIRVDSFLVRQLRNYTPFRMQRIVRCGAVVIDGNVVPLPRRVRRGERVSVRLIEPPDKLFDPEDLPLQILFEDESLIAVDKPAGQIAHPVGQRQTGTLCNAIQYHFDQQTELTGVLRPGIVHRLDRMTSGALIVAKDFLAHKRLSIQFQRNRIEKQYLALVEGVVKPNNGEIDQPIGRIPGGYSILMTTRPDACSPKPACTRFEVVERYEWTTLVRAKPLTGRIHQIRVHFAAIGHPILGDKFYGPFGEIRASRFDAFGDRSDDSNPNARHLLHASQIAFDHPVTRERTAVTAPPPADFSC